LTARVAGYIIKDMLWIQLRKYVYPALCIFLLLPTACLSLPGNPDINKDVAAIQTAVVRKMSTPSYAGGGAVIFTLSHVADGNLKAIVEQIIRVFGQNSAPLDLAILPDEKDSKLSDLSYLTGYVNEGIIDVSLDGYYINWLPPGTSRTSAAYNQLRDKLAKARESLNYSFGFSPVACSLPSDDFSNENYQIIQETGFRILNSPNSRQFQPSTRPLNESGKPELNGLCRLPTLFELVYPETKAKITTSQQAPDINSTLLDGISQSLDSLDVAVVGLRPESFLGRDNKVDPQKLVQLDSLIKSSQKIGELTTFESWYKYASANIFPDRTSRHRVLPPYQGGPAVIFRLDDVAEGFNEDVVLELIQLFKNNGVPLDLGIVSNADDTDSFKLAWLQKYIDQGVVGISVHGYDWTYYQLATNNKEIDYQLKMTGDTCSVDYASGTSRVDNSEITLTYAYIKSKLKKARSQYLQYFGVSPVALTVPTDYFDETGYKAVQDAGFKVFSTHISVETRPSVERVDYWGKKDPNGMYRIPTASDVCVWEQCVWGEIIDISKPAGITGYCQYYGAWEDAFYNELSTNTCQYLGYLGVVAISLHPDAFLDKYGKPDLEKIKKVDAIVKWVKTFATITTFEQWYNYTEGKKTTP